MNCPRALRVLVVDDEGLLRWSIAETLANGGHTVLEAGSARAAVDAMNKAGKPIDVVLLDFRLPDSNDLGLLAKVRRLMPATAVVMMTAFGTPDVTQKALDLGAYRVISKPFDMGSLESLVQDASGSSSVQD